jgi:hypothetical protein
MKFFSGFCFNNEEILFEEYLNKSKYNVSGFSYGAIKAVEYVNNSDLRVDTLQLFSPAFFNNVEKKFIRVQLLHFKKDRDSYIKNFLQNSIYPSSIKIDKFYYDGSYSELEELLTYNWDIEKIKTIVKKGTILEVFLGEDDKIIDSKVVKDFFSEYATIYMIKNSGHILKSN